MRVVLVVLVALTLFLWAPLARAYPWMIRHGETGCAMCHIDPSGAGILNTWGHEQSELLLSTRYGRIEESADAGRFSKSLFGLVPMPGRLDVGGWVRGGYLLVSSGGALVDKRALLMRADIGAQLRVDRFRASATVGYATTESAAQSQQAYLLGPHLVSREHWLGADLDDGRVLLRGGRLNLPFGLRNIEHTSWVRSATRTDFNQSQQHGLALAYHNDVFRAEGMAILGNYQIRPDDYRERGFSGYGEFAFGSHAALGASILIAHAALDLSNPRPTLRQAHGLFGRVSFWEPLVLLGEADVLIDTSPATRIPVGHVEFVQADLEAIQGVHLIVTGENLHQTRAGAAEQFGPLGRRGVVFPASLRCSFRLDLSRQRGQRTGIDHVSHPASRVPMRRFVLAMICWLTPGTALASPVFPGVVAEVTRAAHSPQCVICHETPQGGLGTATRPFAVYLRSRGLVAKDESSLRNALAAAKGEQHDTDGDGVIDVEELAAGKNPNGETASAPPIEYGCGNITGQEPTDGAGLGWLLVAVVAAIRIVAKRRR